MKTPAVSIVLPVYNRLPYLRESVASVLAQTFADWELIIADDGSDEVTRAWLRTLADPRIRVLWLSHVGNPGTVRNAALAEARADHVAFLDSDDYWRPAKLARQLEHLRACGGRWSHTAYDCVGPQGGPLAHRWVPTQGRIFRDILAMRAQIALPAVMAERALLDEAGGFDADQVQHGDYELWLRLVLRSDLMLLDEPLTVVRNHREHYTRGGAWALRWKSRLYEKAQSLARDPHDLAAVRALRARNAGDLMRVEAAEGRRDAAWQAFVATFALGWWRPRWWASAALALLRARRALAAGPSPGAIA
ncbi:MAG TPA: glycosyltransferase family A protein [Steroidobacteraceae bacterium]